ncbi:MAG: outer membrane protein assembly factor BamD [Pyrinomonadaceae bacterium]|nr:outer membrane protein assembly factor BamD [Pyrinomonadaceae bacterium]
MKKIVFLFCLLFFSAALSQSATAQDKPDEPVSIDVLFEQDAKHNLNVANQYFKLKKAYIAVLARFEETLAAYPQFSKMDEFYYIAGMSSYYLSENKGKQKVELLNLSDEEKEKYAPEKLKEDATAYFGIILEKYPNSERRGDAEKMLKKLKDEK